eukprot:Em0003g861a
MKPRTRFANYRVIIVPFLRLNPPTNTSGPGAQTTLTIPGSYEFDGAYVTCYYTQLSTSLKLYSSPAFLRVQGPPQNLTATLIGNSLFQLSWIPSNGGWIGSFLDYIVLVVDGNGVIVHNETVRNSQLIINTSDPCSQYYATVAPVCQGTVSVASIGGSQIPGVSPSDVSQDNITTKFTYPDWPADNVTVTIKWKLSPVAIGAFTSILALLIFLLVAEAFCICALCKKKNRSKHQPLSIPDGRQINLECCVAYSVGSSEPIKLSHNHFERHQAAFADILVNSHQLKLESEPIGEGEFGVVYGAVIQSNGNQEAVVVKTVKEFYSRSDVEQFFNECYRMKAFKHPNVVELIGMCLDSPDGFPLMILPLYPNGNLKAYLQKRRGFSPFMTTLPEGLSTSNLVAMCLDIAQGMEYLAGKGFVHRDLAARNCMVDFNLCVKVGDFGFTRETSCKTSQSQKCPVKWMPPEMLQDGISTEKTDVVGCLQMWAYGVTCWEIFSLGTIPYPGVENYEILELLCKGFRMKKPTLCPENMFKLIECCWNNDSERRPSFLELVTSLMEFVAQFED